MAMSRTTLRDAFDPACPIRNVLSRISDKWSLLVLYTLSLTDGPVRFGELRRQIPDLSQKMMTVTLRTLEEDGFVNRKSYPEVPPRVEYTLTDRAKTLFPHIQSLRGWAKDNMPAIITERQTNLNNQR